MFVFCSVQVKKLQAMLRQANDQLERTISEKQELEDSVKQGHEETNTKVGSIFIIHRRASQHPAVSQTSATSPPWDQSVPLRHHLAVIKNHTRASGTETVTALC